MSEHDEPALPRTPAPLVVVVADDLTHRSIVTRMVRSLGFRVRGCATSCDALAFLRQHPHDAALLLADLKLDGLDGYALADRALELAPGLLVVFMVTLTGSHIDELIDQIPFVAKPVSFGELAGVLHDLLGQPADGPSDPPPMARPRRRRTSGRHEL
jgi:CheY-like chemotaxis protein